MKNLFVLIVFSFVGYTASSQDSLVKKEIPAWERIWPSLDSIDLDAFKQFKDDSVFIKDYKFTPIRPIIDSTGVASWENTVSYKGENGRPDTVSRYFARDQLFQQYIIDINSETIDFKEFNEDGSIKKNLRLAIQKGYHFKRYRTYNDDGTASNVIYLRYHKIASPIQE